MSDFDDGHRSEAVNMDGVLVNALFDEECVDLLALVALKLDDLPELSIIDDVTVACEFLFGRGGPRQYCEVAR